MKKSVLLFSVLLLATAFVVAQQQQSNPSGSTSTTMDQTASTLTSSANASTVQGCLSGSDNNFTLTTSSGTTYALQGKTDNLKDHVGHTVEVTGTPSASSTATTTGGTSSASSANVLQISSIRH